MKLFFSLLIVILLTQCKSQQDSFYEPYFEPVKSYRIQMPIYDGSNSYARIIEFVDNIIMIYFYPLDTLFVYDARTTELTNRIPIKYSSLHGIKFINTDSIWLFGEIRSEHSHSFMLIDISGRIKKKVDIRSYVKHEDLKDYAQVFENKFLYDKKLFFTLYFYKEDGKNMLYRKHPIIGYYDIIKDSVILNNELYFPYIKDGIYYSVDDYLMRYCPFYTINEKNDEIIISFSYTPTFYVWNFKSNALKLYHSAKSCLYDSVIPFHKPINRNDPEFYSYSKKTGFFWGLKFFKGQNIYSRTVTLPENEYGYMNNVLIFLDSNKQYIGEIISNHLTVENNRIFLLEHDNDSLLLAFSSEKDLLNIYLGKIKFKLSHKQKYIKKMQAIAQTYKRKEEDEICQIIGSKKQIEKKDILLYLKNKHNITDNSFSTIILNANGCTSCNHYLLNNFLIINKNVLFNINQNPFYLVYIEPYTNMSQIKQNVLHELCDYENKLKIDTTNIYENFNSFNSFNPRLILVKNQKIVLDTVYPPQEVVNIIFSLLNFYDLKYNNK